MLSETFTRRAERTSRYLTILEKRSSVGRKEAIPLTQKEFIEDSSSGLIILKVINNIHLPDYYFFNSGR